MLVPHRIKTGPASSFIGDFLEVLFANDVGGWLFEQNVVSCCCCDFVAPALDKQW